MRLLITGASGTLGLITSAHAERKQHTVFGGYHSNPMVGGGTPVQIDLMNANATSTTVNELKPDCILHLAVSDRTKPVKYSIPKSTQHIVDASQQSNARLIFMSTDMVFDGKMPPYSEEAPPSPINPYGIAKFEAEQIALQHPNCLIVRTSLIYGFRRENRQLGWMLDTIDGNKPVTLFKDELRQPIYEHDLAEALLRLTKTTANGIMHIVGPDVLSRVELGYALLEAAGIDAVQHIAEITAHHHPNPRPQRLILTTERFKQSPAGFKLRSLKEAAQHHHQIEHHQPNSTTTKR